MMGSPSPSSTLSTVTIARLLGKVLSMPADCVLPVECRGVQPAGRKPRTVTPMGSYDELDATLTRVAAEKSDAVADVVAVVRGRSAGVDRTPAEAIAVLNSWYLRQQATDAGARAAGRTAQGLVSALRPEAAASLDRTMIYLLALADLHGVTLDDEERRKTLLMAVLLGDEGAKLATSALTGTSGTWARRLVGLPRVGNPLLGQLVGMALNTGLSVAMAAGGESIQAQAVVTQATRAFGEPPTHFPGQKPRTPRPTTSPRTRSAMGSAAAEPMTTTGVYARALARTIAKAKKRSDG